MSQSDVRVSGDERLLCGDPATPDLGVWLLSPDSGVSADWWKGNLMSSEAGGAAPSLEKELAMRLRDKINEDLTAAMKQKNAERLSVLRMMKAAVKNREIEERTELDDSKTVAVLVTLIKQRQDSIEQFTRGGRQDLADKEAREIPVIEEYLPAAVTDEEIAAVVDEVVRQSGAVTIKDLGLVMKQCMARFAGKLVDGKKVNAAVRQRLEGKA
jgi:uncharacterized protein